jgi:hypothetical protein
MATLDFDPTAYGGVAPLSLIGPGQMFWWNSKGVAEPALRLVTPEPDHRWRVVHFPTGKMPKYVEHDPGDAGYYLLAGVAKWRVDGVPSGPVATSGEKAGTICVGASTNEAILCATSSQGVVKIDLGSHDLTTQNLRRAPFKRWSVGVLDVDGEFFGFYKR